MNSKQFQEWQEKYKDILVVGLTDGPTYLRLQHKVTPMVEVDLAMRPFAQRVTGDWIVVGAKLSVFPRVATAKEDPGSVSVAVGWLTSAYPDMAFEKKDARRVGTVFMRAIRAPVNSRKGAVEFALAAGIGEKLVAYAETRAGITADSRKLVVRAAEEFYRGVVPNLFVPETEGSAEEFAFAETFAIGDDVNKYVIAIAQGEMVIAGAGAGTVPQGAVKH